MYATLAYAFLAVSGAYMTVYHWRRRTTNDKAGIATGLQAVATVAWVFLFVSHVN